MSDSIANAAEDPLDEIVASCLESTGADLDRAVDRACSDHPAQAPEIRKRISALRQVGLVLREAGEGRTQGFPERLGDFRLLERLGGGGMGVVYRARQESLGREVALKLIRPEHLYFPRARERFRRETEAVARLQHPGIVPIYTVGEENGIPYFAMELVAGCTLAEVVRELEGRAPESLTGRDLHLALRSKAGRAALSDERVPAAFEGPWTECTLKCVIQVAEALHHAHARDVLHRDVKPSNIALTLEGRAMLLDFGLATLGGEEVRMTASGTALGSVLYMSPEQIRGDSAHVDRRSDVYALGVTLYELLTLQAPYFDTNPLGTRQAILEGRTDAIRARNRAVSKDLETVCFKAMEREPARRYADAAAFARDLRNVLELRPVEARPPSTALRARRWVQRNPATSVALALGGVLVLAAPSALYLYEQQQHARALRDALAEAKHARELGQALDDAQRARAAAEASGEDARKQRDRAQVEAHDAQQVAEFLTGLFAASDPANTRGKTVTAQDLLAEGVERLQTELTDQPEVRARLLVRMGQSYSSLGDYARARPLLEESLAIRRELFGDESEEVADSLYGLGNSLRLVGDKEALPMLEHALEIDRAAHPTPTETTARYEVAVASCLSNARRYDEAIEGFQRALAIQEGLGGDRRKLRELCLSNLASANQAARNLEQAIENARLAVALSRELHGEPHPGLVSSLNTLALSLKGLKRYEEARPVYDELLTAAERLYGRENDRFATFTMNKASFLDDIGEYREAQELYDQAWATLQRVTTPDNPHSVSCRGNMAGLYVRTTKWELARDAYEDCIPRLFAVDGEQSARALLALNNLGLCYEALGDFVTAAERFRRSLETADAIHDNGRPWRVARAKAHLARVLVRGGALDEPRRMLGEVQEYVDSNPERTSVAALWRYGLALLALASSDGESAEPLLSELAGLGKTDDETAWVPIAARMRRASFQIAVSPADARRDLDLALAQLESKLGPEHPETLAALDAALAAATATGDAQRVAELRATRDARTAAR